MPRPDLRDQAAPRPPRHGDRGAAVAYIARMSDQLREIARREGCPTLAYLLDMARLEAELRAHEAKERGAGSGPDVGFA